MNDSSLPPAQGTGRRDGSSSLDAPDGYVSWHEHYNAWTAYRRLGFGTKSAEEVANAGGFTFAELNDYLGHPPKTWVPRDIEHHANWLRDYDGRPEDLDELPPSKLRSHIRFSGDAEPICKNPASVPDRPFNFDSEEATYCSPCLRKLHNWVAGWITTTPTDRNET